MKITGPNAVKSGQAAKVKVQVKARGNAVVDQGTVTLTINGPGGFLRTIQAKVVNGKDVILDLGKLKKPGKYKMAAVFKGAPSFRDSSDTDTITVKKKKKD